MRALITSDLHLTSNSEDEYRFEVFDRMTQVASEGKSCTDVFILGDLTDAKDKHPASLVSRIVYAFETLAVNRTVHVVKGNHDYVDPQQPFFGFLDHMDGVKFYSDPFFYTDILVVPHSFDGWALGCSREGLVGWSDLLRNAQSDRDLKPKLIVCHHTFGGAKASNGFTLEGGDSGRVFSTELSPCPTVVSGDIHVPQQCGDVVYVGSPYPVRFGDVWQPRFLIWDGDSETLESVEIPYFRKDVVTLQYPGSFPLPPHPQIGVATEAWNRGDQVKVRVEIPSDQFGVWEEVQQEVHQWAEVRGLRLRGPELIRATPRERFSGDLSSMGASPMTTTPEALLDTYADQQGTPGPVREKAAEAFRGTL